MKQKQFETEHAALWCEIDTVLASKQDANAHFPGLYRRLCQSLALSAQRGYSPQLTEHLHQLAMQCHQKLYGTAVERPFTLHRWILFEFPQRVRQEWRLLLLAMLAFWGVALVIGLMVWFQPEWAYSFTSSDDLNNMRSMYQSSSLRVGRGGSAGDVQMFGFYIWNNVSIGFRTFAGGLFAGLPALFSIVFNGINLGVAAAWLSMESATRGNFWSFVITHSSFEITGLLLSGVAGMRMGLALLCPGRLSRRHALVSSSRAMFPVLIGAALLTALAAFFEAFWSGSTSIAHSVKYAVGAICWLAVLLFFVFAGRGGDANR